MITAQWITNRNFDLLWYISAAITGYALIYINLALGVSTLFLLWFWIVTVDGPHVFGTLSRTFLDREEWKSRRKLFLSSLLWFLPGPLMLFAGVMLNQPLPFFIFIIFAQLWAYWHVVRQHYGFLTLYQKKNGEMAGKANPIDYWTFYILMLAPFISFLLRNPEARSLLGLQPTSSQPEQIILLGLHSLIAVTLVFYVAKEIGLVQQKKSWNLPKNLFLVACIPLHLFLFLHPYVSTHVDVRMVAVFVTFYHNIQYHGIIWFYNRNRYGEDRRGEKYGWAGKVSRSFLTYYAAGVLFTLAYRYPNWFFMGLNVPLAPGPNVVSAFALGPHFTVADLAYVLWWGFALNHYYLDQKIWKLSKDRKLTSDLKMDPIQPAVLDTMQPPALITPKDAKV
jgi:hypothetical protein